MGYRRVLLDEGQPGDVCSTCGGFGGWGRNHCLMSRMSRGKKPLRSDKGAHKPNSKS